MDRITHFFIKTTSHYYGANEPSTPAAVKTDSGVSMFCSVSIRRRAVENGVSARLPTNLAQEWRTPPLWGAEGFRSVFARRPGRDGD